MSRVSDSRFGLRFFVVVRDNYTGRTHYNIVWKTEVGGRGGEKVPIFTPFVHGGKLLSISL